MPKAVVRRPARTSAVLSTLERTGFRKGMGGSKGWFYVGTGLWTVRTLRRLGERREEILISERLRPGERLVIANGVATIEGAPDPRPTGRRARRKAAKRERKAAKRQRKAAKRGARSRRRRSSADAG